MIIDAEDARAGKTNMGVRYVLWASLTLTVAVMIALIAGYL